MIRCLITDGTASRNQKKWIEHKAAWIAEGIELLQIRERDLSPRELARLTREVLSLPNPHGTRVLVNDRADVAIACRAHGVHLRDGSLQPEIFSRLGLCVSVACHSIADVEKTKGADFVLLAPIFAPLSKTDLRPSLGTNAIREITKKTPTPILALGGITEANARLTVEAGAAGIAGISFFKDGPPSQSARLSVHL